MGGTTGAGKSEFLQAWVLGMAAAHSPDRVTFLFVDYKGGSAFADCVDLPHCVGLVTDLSPHLVRRALTSLRAELHHRDHLLNRKKAKDLLELADIKILGGQKLRVARELDSMLGFGPIAQDLVSGWAMHDKGRALWCVGDATYKVQTVLHPLEKKLYYTNEAIEAAL